MGKKRAWRGGRSKALYRGLHTKKPKRREEKKRCVLNPRKKRDEKGGAVTVEKKKGISPTNEVLERGGGGEIRLFSSHKNSLARKGLVTGTNCRESMSIKLLVCKK